MSNNKINDNDRRCSKRRSAHASGLSSTRKAKIDANSRFMRNESQGLGLGSSLSSFRSPSSLALSPELSSSSSSSSSKSKSNRKGKTLYKCANPPDIPDLLHVMLPEALIHNIMSYIVHYNGIDITSYLSMQCVCHRWHTLSCGRELWSDVPHVLPSGVLNMNVFKQVKEKCKGTEGTCYHTISRKDQKSYALKRARVYPNNEGVPYYMMRELASLKKINHPNICGLLQVNLHEFKLHLLFPYIEMTLADYMEKLGKKRLKINNSNEDGNSIDLTDDTDTGNNNEPSMESLNKWLHPHQVKALSQQLLNGVEYCHDRGILHRNLKPKHLLIIPGNGEDPLDDATLKIADFALVRIFGHPPKKFTTEVITLWYRPPEILMGEQSYTSAVDMWSVGCIISEMIRGAPLFYGLCEIDQLFQIFFKMGKPNDHNPWDDFESLPNYREPLFPNWEQSQLPGLGFKLRCNIPLS